MATPDEVFKLGERIVVPRGRCVICLKPVRLRLDGTVGSHQHWIFPCGGTGHAPVQEESK